jgi:hypothetical protein
MKTLTKIALALIPALTLSMTAIAHDTESHAAKAANFDCSTMDHSTMDHSKMDMKDPAVSAMIKNCMKQGKKSKADMMSDNKIDKMAVKKAKIAEKKKMLTDKKKMMVDKIDY